MSVIENSDTNAAPVVLLNQAEKRDLERKLAKQISLEESEQILVDQALFPCKSCDRKFNEDALEKHQKVCKIVFGTKRTEFDSQFQRLGGKGPLPLLSNGTTQRSSSQKRNSQQQRGRGMSEKSRNTDAYTGSLKPNKDGKYLVIQQGKKVFLSHPPQASSSVTVAASSSNHKSNNVIFSSGSIKNATQINKNAIVSQYQQSRLFPQSYVARGMHLKSSNHNQNHSSVNAQRSKSKSKENAASNVIVQSNKVSIQPQSRQQSNTKSRLYKKKPMAAAPTAQAAHYRSLIHDQSTQAKPTSSHLQKSANNHAKNTGTTAKATTQASIGTSSTLVMAAKNKATLSTSKNKNHQQPTAKHHQKQAYTVGGIGGIPSTSGGNNSRCGATHKQTIQQSSIVANKSNKTRSHHKRKDKIYHQRRGGTSQHQRQHHKQQRRSATNLCTCGAAAKMLDVTNTLAAAVSSFHQQQQNVNQGCDYGCDDEYGDEDLDYQDDFNDYDDEELDLYEQRNLFIEADRQERKNSAIGRREREQQQLYHQQHRGGERRQYSLSRN